MADNKEAVRTMLAEILAPLFAVEGGHVYLVSVDKKKVALHLTGTLSGSPATHMVTRRVVEPAIKAVSPKLEVIVTSGWSVPEGAQLIEAEAG
ncbi:MAG: NifU family protein [Polyangiaceae bacterium]